MLNILSFSLSLFLSFSFQGQLFLKKLPKVDNFGPYSINPFICIFAASHWFTQSEYLLL